MCVCDGYYRRLPFLLRARYGIRPKRDPLFIRKISIRLFLSLLALFVRLAYKGSKSLAHVRALVENVEREQFVTKGAAELFNP